MPKQRRAAASRSPSRPAAKKSRSGSRASSAVKARPSKLANSPAKRPASAKVIRRPAASKLSSAKKSTPPRKLEKAQRPVTTAAQAAPAPVNEPPAPPRRPAFYEALAIYETGVRALQRHDFEAAANSLRSVIQGYPGERELVERARLYLQVCERETSRRPSGPQTPTEWVYAATVALNAGDVEAALGHLGRALERAPESDHAHYIMSVALVDKGEPSMALVHLRQAIALNPDNKSVALNDPDLAALQGLEAFHRVLETADEALAPKTKARR
jgi:tetratricopeptide (TPR) repeat protein